MYKQNCPSLIKDCVCFFQEIEKHKLYEKVIPNHTLQSSPRHHKGGPQCTNSNTNNKEDDLGKAIH